MKYTIVRNFSLKKEKFEIISDSKTVCTAKASSSKVHKGQFNVKLSTPLSKRFGDESCTIEPHATIPRNYLIYIENEKNNEKTLFGQVCYELCSYDNYLYTIIIGAKLYKVRSCDLKHRRLAIIDTIEQNIDSKTVPYSLIQCPETLFQVIDSFSKANKSYHVTINDKEKQIGYLAIIILLDLHECKRAESKN